MARDAPALQISQCHSEQAVGRRICNRISPLGFMVTTAAGLLSIKARAGPRTFASHSLLLKMPPAFHLGPEAARNCPRSRGVPSVIR